MDIKCGSVLYVEPFGHRGDLLAFVICVKAGLIWHGLQSSEEIVRGPAL